MLDTLFKNEPNRARYLPAVTHDYAKRAVDANWSCGPIRGPQLDFLSRKGLFHYPAALASAGQVSNKSGTLDPSPTMISGRNRANSFVMGDSGGFQIQEGTRPWFDAGHPLDSVQTMQGWMERNTDCVTALDFPTKGISAGRYAEHIKRIESSGMDLRAQSAASGLSVAYHACLHQTLLNTRRMLDSRKSQLGTYKRRHGDLSPNQSRFLVVLQGRNERESQYWYEASKDLIREADGVSFAGAASRNFHLMLHRLLDMKRDGLLGSVRHIHVLGNGLLMTGVVLTCIQRNLRAQTDAQDVQITHDTAEPFQTGGRQYEVYTHLIANHAGWQLHRRPISDAQAHHHHQLLNDWCWLVERDSTPRRKGASGEGHAAAVSQLGFNITVQQLLNAAQGKHKGLGVPSHEAAWVMCLHNTEVAVRARSLAIDMYHNKQMDRLPPDIVHMTILIDTAFNHRKSLKMVAGADGNSRNTYKRLLKTFDIRTHLNNNAGILAGRM